MTTISFFDAAFYLKQNPDVAEAVANGQMTVEEHFELYGKFEGRAPNASFNPTYYLESNPDVAAAVEQGFTTAQDHFNQYGKFEGRTPSPLFDPEFYLAQSPDVAAAIIESGGALTAYDHFMSYGFNEARAINPAIHLGDYLKANPDVAEAVQMGYANAFDHLTTYGIHEGRDLGNGVSLEQFANDKAFNAALESDNIFEAMAIVAAVSPFIPTFQAPQGWSAPENLPIPTSFVPAEGEVLVIPQGVVVPDGIELPDFFKPSSETPAEPDKPVNPEPETPTDPAPEKPVDPETPADPEPNEPEPEEPVVPEPETPINPKPDEPEPVVPAPEEPNIPSPEIFKDWTLVIPTYEGLSFYHQGEEVRFNYEGNGLDSYLNLTYIDSNLEKGQIQYIYYHGYNLSSGSQTNYQGEVYLFDIEEGLESLGNYDGAYSLSPAGDMAFFGNQSMVISSDFSQSTQSAIRIPQVNSDIVWSDDASQVWFSANSAPYGTELFSYTIDEDLSLEGGLVKDIIPGSESGIDNYYFANNFALLPNGNAIFYTNTSHDSNQFWLSDGTEENTKPLDFLGNIGKSYYSSSIERFQDKVTFSARKDTYDEEGYYRGANPALVITNGEESNTHIIELESHDRSSLEILWTTDEAIFFSAVDNEGANNIYKTEGENSYVKMMVGFSVDFLGQNEEKAFLAIHDDMHGKELWVMDTQSGDTELLKDILPGTGSSLGGYQNAQMVNDKLLFTAYTSATTEQLFISDGTESGTVALSDGSTNPGAVANLLLTVDNHIFYSENDSLYAVNTELDKPIATLVKENYSLYSGNLQHDKDQIFFKEGYQGPVYSYDWRVKELEKIMDSVDVFSVVDENVVFGLGNISGYSEDEDGFISYYSAAEWFLSDGTAYGTESTIYKDNHFNTEFLKNATLLNTSIDLIGDLPQVSYFDDLA